MSNISNERAHASQGDFFFASFFDPRTGYTIKHPVFVVGKHGDSNDQHDVIICNCTSQPARSVYDILVLLKKPTLVRTNKLYTIRRDQLLFKISDNADVTPIIQAVKKAVALQVSGSA